MKKPWRIVAFILGCVLLLVALPVRAQAERRIALVIGNGAYRDAPLKNPANDAKAIAAVLAKQGFKVILRQNATKSEMESAVAEFGEQLNQDSVGLFFFAGHGMQVGGRNYLVPSDAKITSEQRVRLETLDVDIVLEQMQAARVRVSMVILDACRNNPFERRFRSFGGGLAQINAPEGTIIAYATAPGKVASDGDGANGLYTTELLHALQQPGVRVEDVFKQVRVRVSRASNGAQVPWEASSLVGDFYFTSPPAAASASPAPQAGAVDREMVFWNSVKDSGSAAELDAYLAAYPDGTFASLARSRRAAVSAQAKPPSSALRTGGTENAGQQQAALPPARDAFDGRWVGEHGCFPFAGFPEWRQARQLIIHNRQLTYSQGEKDKPGYLQLAGTVSESGSVSVEGYGISPVDQRKHPVYFSGSIDGGKLTVRGTQGQRACWLTLERVAGG